MGNDQTKAIEKKAKTEINKLIDSGAKAFDQKAGQIFQPS